MSIKSRATIEDLYNVPDKGKAELVNGEIVLIGPSGWRHGRAAGAIIASLCEYEDVNGEGRVLGSRVAFLVDLPNRGSFSPDVSWYVGNAHTMKFPEGAPKFAVGVREIDEYGTAAERAIQAKIADYFAAGTQVVWDVDLLGEDTIKVYRNDNPAVPTIYRRGEVAKAEPAVPGWRFPVDELFE